MRAKIEPLEPRWLLAYFFSSSASCVADRIRVLQKIFDSCVVNCYGGARIAFRSSGSKKVGFSNVDITNCSVANGGDFGILVGDGAIEQPTRDNGLPIDGGTYSHKHVTI